MPNTRDEVRYYGSSLHNLTASWQQQWVPRTLDSGAPFLFPACQEGRAKLHPRPQRGDSWREECKGLARQAGCGREAGVEPEPALYGHGGRPLI